MLGRSVVALLDRGIPPTIVAPSDRVRARLIQAFFAVGTLGFAAAAGTRVAVGVEVARTHLVMLPAFLLGLFTLPATGRLRFSSWVAVGLASTGVIANTLEVGGFVPVMSWAALVVMGAAFLLGVRAGAIVVAGFVLAGVGVTAGHALGLFHGFEPSILDPVRGSISWTVVLSVQATMCLALMRFYASEHGRLAERLEAARAEADQASRAKSIFLATMSHEIRTPMNGVLAAADLLRRADLAANERELAEVIFDSGEALLTVLNDVLDFSKIEAGRVDLQTAPFDPRDLAARAVDLLRPKAREKGLTLRSTVDASVPAGLAGDAGRLRQVLLNLLANAVKFTERGEVHLLISAPRPGAVSFSVRDTGPGIPEASQGKLFQPFAQVERPEPRDGSGLGLAISARLVEAMGGKINLESALGRGSTFTFDLELTPAEPPLVRKTGPTPRERPVHDPILVVDDNDVNRLLAERMLRKLGFSAKTATSGEEALELLEHERFSLVLMDRRLPGLDGLEVTRRVRRAPGPSHTTPIVALTASVMREELEACTAAGMNGVLTKPVTLEVLETCVERCAAR